MASPTCCSKFTSNVTSLGIDKSARGSQREDPFSVLHEKLRQEPLLSQAPPNLFDVGLLAQNHGGKLRHRHLLFSYSHCHSLPPADNNNSVVLDPMKEAAHRTRTLSRCTFFCSLCREEIPYCPRGRDALILAPISFHSYLGLLMWPACLGFGIHRTSLIAYNKFLCLV